MNNDIVVLTPSALLAFLTQIDELKDVNIEMEEYDSFIKIKIGENHYTLEAPESSAVEVSNDVVDEVSDLNDEGYDEISEDIEEGNIDGELVEGEAIEGGIVKELLKTLAVGGLVRLTKGAIVNS
mgnify:CR=1 FL=1